MGFEPVGVRIPSLLIIHYRNSKFQRKKDPIVNSTFFRVGFKTRININNEQIKNKEWTGRDLNPWPPPCQGGDLPADLPALKPVIVIKK